MYLNQIKNTIKLYFKYSGKIFQYYVVLVLVLDDSISFFFLVLHNIAKFTFYTVVSNLK